MHWKGLFLQFWLKGKKILLGQCFHRKRMTNHQPVLAAINRQQAETVTHNITPIKWQHHPVRDWLKSLLLTHSRAIRSQTITRLSTISFVALMLSARLLSCFQFNSSPPQCVINGTNHYPTSIRICVCICVCVAHNQLHQSPADLFLRNSSSTVKPQKSIETMCLQHSFCLSICIEMSH